MQILSWPVFTILTVNFLSLTKHILKRENSIEITECVISDVSVL